MKPVTGTFLYTNGELTNNPTGENSSLKGISQLEAGAFIEDRITLSDRFSLRPEIRLTLLLSDLKTVHFLPEPRTQQVEVAAFFNPGTFYRGEVNLFLKNSRDLYMYREGASFVLYPRWEDNIIPVTGLAYGAEFLLQAELHKTYALLNYTLSKTTWQSPEINNGERFDHKYDRPHVFRLSIGYKITQKLSISGSFVMQSGTVFSFYDRIIQGDLPWSFG